MNLRIYRTFSWCNTSSLIGSLEYSLVGTDELQYRNHKEEWVPVPIVDAEKPEHPDAVKVREAGEEINKFIEDTLWSHFCSADYDRKFTTWLDTCKLCGKSRP